MPKSALVVFLTCVSLGLTACAPNLEAGKEDVITHTASTHIKEQNSVTDYRGLPDQDYTLLRDDLYKGADGYLYFLTSEAKGLSDGPSDLIPVYLKRFGYYNSDFPDRPQSNLSEKIDPETWRQVHDTIYADANNIYCRHDLSSGARLNILAGFTPGDTSFVYVRNGTVPNLALNLATPESLPPGFGWYLYHDKKYIDYRCRDKSLEEVRVDLKAQIALNPPDYSNEMAMPIKR